MIRVGFLFALPLAALLLVGCAEGPVGPDPAATADARGSDAPVSLSKGGAVENFVAPLSGDEVVPPVDTRARGLAKFKLNKAGDKLAFKLNVANIDDVIGAHIHMAEPGVNGPIVVFLFGDPFAPAVTVNGTLAEGTITASDVLSPIAGDFGALLDAMEAGNTYVQVHTTAHPPGEIRGQIDVGNGVSRQ